MLVIEVSTLGFRGNMMLRNSSSKSDVNVVCAGGIFACSSRKLMQSVGIPKMLDSVGPSTS